MYGRKQVWGKCSHVYLCAIGTGRKKRKEKKFVEKEKNEEKCVKSMKKELKSCEKEYQSDVC